MTGPSPLGIDLGTTFSVVAAVDGHGRAEVLRNELDEQTVPSVVHFESPSSVLVGSAARDAGALDPQHTVALIKRQMGTGRLLEFFGTAHTPESISALILRALVQGVAVGRTGPQPGAGTPVPAVVTVPAYFGIAEREATHQACLLAGIEVLELVSEPVAAAIHYGLSGPSEHGLAVVYDLGGGTFDATLLKLGERMAVLATDGDAGLGGADWDTRLADHLLDRFTEATAGEAEPAEDPAFTADLRLAAERLKRDLTRALGQLVTVRHGDRAVRVSVTRDEFEAMTRDLVDQTLLVVRRLLRQAGRVPAEVDRVLLVGGSSRMPMIASALAAEFGWRPRLHDPDLAVAKGAALRAHHLVRLTHPGIMLARAGAELATVVPRGLGLLVEDSDDPAAARLFVDHVIRQNEPLPILDRAAELATILRNQGRVKISVYEQAGAVASPEVAHNRMVLEGELIGLPAGLPAGSPIEVRFSLGLDGRLELTAVEPRSRTSLRLEACVEGVIDTAARQQAAGRLGAMSIRQ
ncbi:Hsp70 family protein [Catellatospora sp. NPDC049111]|uniref:Hsp70 family protein n=1 Tax=Catellatospora sp. NPDC049111 TaxID=3155271 RepID=UPI0033E3A640